MQHANIVKLVGVSLIGAASLTAGCVPLLVAGAAAVGVAGTYVYTEGRLESVEDAPLSEVHAAAVQAVKDMEFDLKRESKDALQSRVTAERADDTDIHIAMEKQSESTTSVRIRVGVMGDETVSRKILERLRANLGTATASAEDTGEQT